MKAFKDCTLKDNIIEGVVIFLLLWPVFAIWVAAKRAGAWESGFVMATALHTFIPLGVLGLYGQISKLLNTFSLNLLGALLIIYWLGALGYAIVGNSHRPV